MEGYEIIGFIFISVIRVFIPILLGLAIGFGWHPGVILSICILTILNGLITHIDLYHYKKSYGG